jgi:hypothetical protein
MPGIKRNSVPASKDFNARSSRNAHCLNSSRSSTEDPPHKPGRLECNHVVCIAHRLEAMGNEQHGSTLEGQLDRASNADLPGQIERTHCFVEDEESRITHNRTCKTKTLTARKARAMLPDPGVVLSGNASTSPRRPQPIRTASSILATPSSALPLSPAGGILS